MKRCQKCQAENEDSAVTCAKCGETLAQAAATDPADPDANTTDQATTTTAAPANPAATAENSTAAAEASAATAETPAATTPAATESAMPHSATSSMPNFFSFLFSAIVKPISTFREQLSGFSNFGAAAIMAVIASAIAMFVNLITAMFNAVVHQYGYRGVSRVEWEWENLGELNYLQLTLLTWLAYLIVIALVAGVFFGVSRIFKRNQTNFCHMIAIISVAIIPAIIGAFLSAIISRFNVLIGSFIMLGCSMYSYLIFYEGVNDEAGVEGNKKVYYNVLSVLAILLIAYVIIFILMQSSMDFGSSSSSLFDF